VDTRVKKRMTLNQVALYEAVLLLATTVNGLLIIRLSGRFQHAEIGEGVKTPVLFFL
jgi:hypothetical protein